MQDKRMVRNKILKESRKLFLENGVQETYISTILKKCEIANGTLFYYFATKDEIVLAIYQDIKDKSENFFYTPEMDQMNFENFLKEYWNKNIDWIIKNSKEYNFIKTFNHYPIIKEQYIKNKSTEKFLNRIKSGIKEKETSIKDIDLFFKTFLGIRDALVSHILDNSKNEKEIKKLAEEYINRFIKFAK